MRGDSQGYLELRDAYERDGLFFAVVRVRSFSTEVSYAFGVERSGYLALRRIFETHPLGSMPGVKHRYFFTGGHSQERLAEQKVDIDVRIEAGTDGKVMSFPCSLSLAKNLKWFAGLKEIGEASHLKVVHG